MHDGEKCCEHCAVLKDSEALKKVVEYAIDATPRSDYLRLGVQQLSELLHKKRDQRDDVCLAALNAHRKIVSLRSVANTTSKLVSALHTKIFHRVGPFLEHHMSQGHSLRYCVALSEQAVTPQLLHKYTEQERDLALLTLRLGGPRILHTFYKAGILPSSPFSKQFQRAENPFNLQGHLHPDMVRTLLGSIWLGLERCPIRTLKDEASLLPRLSVARDPVENGLFFVGLCDCVKERIPYTGIQSTINVMKHLSNGDWHLARHVSICGVARHSREMHAMVPINFKLTCNDLRLRMRLRASRTFFVCGNLWLQSNFASDPEDSSDQDVPALEIARESPENDTTCEYHGLLQAAEDTDQLLFVALEGRRIHVQQLLNIVVNSNLQVATQNYY